MKALSVRQPWAYLIVQGVKDIENRSRRTHYRGEILIHAGKQWASDFRTGTHVNWGSVRALFAAHNVPFPDESAFLTGGIVGKVTIVDCVKNSISPWAFDGYYHWMLRDAKPLPFVASKGKLGLFEVTL